MKPPPTLLNDAEANDFAIRRAAGRKWEDAILAWLTSPGMDAVVIPLFQLRDLNGRPPTFHCHAARLVTPDMHVTYDRQQVFVEVKSKAKLLRSYNGGAWTGIDIGYWQEYLAMHQRGAIIYIFFVHIDEREVRAASIADLAVHKHSWSNPHVRHRTSGGLGMIYWPHDVGTRVARIITAADDERRLRTASRVLSPFGAPRSKLDDVHANAAPQGEPQIDPSTVEVHPHNQSRSV
jgi:hypothetical protein